MKILILSSMILSMIFMKSSHPVGLMAIILSQTMILCLSIWVLTKMNWFSYILFLIFLGGLMVLFIYIASLASNEMFELNVKKNFMTLIILPAIFIATLMNMTDQYSTHLFFSVTKSFNSIYSESMVLPSTATMLYLLLTLIVVVKMTSKYEGPLRSMIFNS